MRADGRGLRRQPEVEGEMGSGSGSGAVHSPGRLTTTTPTTRNPSRDCTTRQRRQQQNTYRFRTTTTARLFSMSPPQQLSAVNFPVPGGGYTICLSESTGRQARSTNTQISIPLWTAAAADPGHWDEAEDKCSGTAAHTHRRFICTGLGCEEGGAGSGDMMASGRPAIRDIFPCAPVRRRPCGVC